jgi:hypothetical protein
VRQKNPLLTDQTVQQLLDHLTQTACRIDPVPLQFSYARDPKDEPYLNLALAAAATYLVTWDTDLLDLMGDSADGIAFRDRFPGLVILTPVAFLRALAEARAQHIQRALLHQGEEKFGAPDEATRRALLAITDLERLDHLSERVGDVAGWQELLQTP